MAQQLWCTPKTVKTRLKNIQLSSQRVLALARNNRCAAAGNEIERWQLHVRKLRNCSITSLRPFRSKILNDTRMQTRRFDRILTALCGTTPVY